MGLRDWIIDRVDERVALMERSIRILEHQQRIMERAMAGTAEKAAVAALVAANDRLEAAVEAL